MSEFDAGWLDQRVAADRAARSNELLDRLALTVIEREVQRCIDIASGTCANLRAIADRLGAEQYWRAVDRDAALLAAFESRTSQWAAAQAGSIAVGERTIAVAMPGRRIEIERVQIDLASRLDELEFDQRTLVTASAFLDLVGSRWLALLVARCRAARPVVYIALTYDGVAECEPSHPDDQWIVATVNRHQRTDKGFGPALGPDAAAVAARAFADAGFEVQSERRDWQLGAAEVSLQASLFDGWAAATRELEPHQAGRIASWRDARRAHLAAGRSRVRVGHRDLLGT